MPKKHCSGPCMEHLYYKMPSQQDEGLCNLHLVFCSRYVETNEILRCIMGNGSHDYGAIQSKKTSEASGIIQSKSKCFRPREASAIALSLTQKA